jgi:DNA polymerase-1
MANYIVTNNKHLFEDLGNYNYCTLEEMVLPDFIAVDTETTGLNARKNHMFSVQIGTGKNNYLIDMQRKGGEITFEEVIPYLEGRAQVGHNYTFDMGFFYQHNYFPKEIYDTFIASKILYNGLPQFRHNFGAVMERELEQVYDKQNQKTIAQTQLSTASAIQYSFNDVDRLVELMKQLAFKLRQSNSMEAFLTNCKYIRAMAYMEQCGMPLNEKDWELKIKEDVEVHTSTKQSIQDYIFDNLGHYANHQSDLFSSLKKIYPSVQSPQQMIPVFKDLGINVVTDEGKESVSSDQLNKIDHEFLPIWAEYKDAVHSMNNFGQNILEKVEDGRIHTSFNPILDTCRISTRKGGVNILNFPANKRTRACIQPKKGFKMIVADYDGQENVVGADLHKDAATLASIHNGDCLHCALARVIFPELLDLSDKEIKDNHSDKRSAGKPVRFAKAYGGSAYSVAASTNKTQEEAQELCDAYDELHSDIKVWGEKELEKAMKSGYIESADGFKLYIQYFKEFQTLMDWFEGCDTAFWQSYGKGKRERLKEIKADEEGDTYVIEDAGSYYLYDDNYKNVSKFFSRRGRVQRLCLNNPIQARSAFQTKRAAILLFEEIEKNNDYWDVKICNIPHDEFVLEVREELAEKYARILERCMKEGGDYYLESGLVSMNAESNIGNSWYEAK